VQAQGAKRITVVADWDAEGQTYRDTHDMKLSDDGNKLSITGFGPSGRTNVIRCPA